MSATSKEGAKPANSASEQPASGTQRAAEPAEIRQPAVDLIDDALDAEAEKERAQTKVRCAEMGIPFVAYPRSADDVARHRAMRLEQKALASRADGSLRSRLMQILSAGAFVADDAGSGTDDATAERALLRYAAATTKATALALRGAEYVTSNEDFEVKFTDKDAAVVMCGLSSLLEAGSELITSIAIADAHAPKSEAAE